jgi:hypothetical protein
VLKQYSIVLKMAIKLFAFYTQLLQQKNYKSFYLSFLRVAISIFLLNEVYFNWPAMDVLYGPEPFTGLKANSLATIHGVPLFFLRTHYMWLIYGYIIVILLNILGVGKWLTGLLLFLMVDFFQNMNLAFVNGGDRMVWLILLWLIFADSYGYFTLHTNKNSVEKNKKLHNLISNLAALSIMLQLCVAYFSSGIQKLNDPSWLNGEGTYYALSMERFMGTSFNKYIVQQKWVDYITNYGTILFELLFPVLIWIKKFRKPLLISGVVFHLCISIFLMIYGFEIVFMMLYGFFLPDKKLVDYLVKIKGFIFQKNSSR